ncbi:MAG: hypothetical protein FD129_3362, partial [bacterium]
MNRKQSSRRIGAKGAAMILTVGATAIGLVTQAADGPGVALT